MSYVDPVMFAVTQLVDDVTSQLAPQSIAVKFGWKEKARNHDEDLLCVMIPGDPSGKVGAVGGPVRAGKIPRPVGCLREAFTVYCSGRNKQFPELERAQYVATRLVLDAFLLAAYKAAYGTYNITGVSWVTDKLERRKGACVEIVGVIQAPIFDNPPTIASPVTADINTSLEVPT